MRKKRERTLTGAFLKYMVLFCINTIALLIIVYGIFFVCIDKGIIFPANYAEQILQKYAEKYRTADKIAEEDIPPGCEYGVFDKDGNWLYGTFPEEEYSLVWQDYEKKNMISGMEYYRFIEREKDEVFIVKYRLATRYHAEILNRILPNPERMVLILFAGGFLLQAVILAKLFSKNLKKRLKQLNEATQKISGNDLDFEMEASDLKEINEVLFSLGRMKDALKSSLKRQWELEEEQNRQLRALSHDIKTPLTIIRGNAELLTEDVKETQQTSDSKAGMDPEFLKSSLECILENVTEMEQYLERMRMILHHGSMVEKQICIAGTQFQEELKNQAVQLTAAKNLPLLIQSCDPDGTIQANREQMKRAWNNVLGNAAEYTDAEQGIDILFSEKEREGKQYLTAAVSDYGRGFSEEELKFAAEEFYRGDESRHDRSHQGLGLAITKRFLEAQGGFLEVKNSGKTGGGEVTLWFLMYPK